jgi:hypothetical protein
MRDDITDKRRVVKTSEKRERDPFDQLFEMMQSRKWEQHDDMPVAVLEQDQNHGC